MKKKTLVELLGVVTIIVVVLALGIWGWLRSVPGSASLGASAPAPLAQDELDELPTAIPSSTPANLAAPTEITPPVSSASQVPMCVFDQQAVSPTAESRLDNYVLSEPRVVLTHAVAIEIVEWLPDNHQLLIKRQISDQTSREYIEVFDTQTGKIQRYGETRYSGTEPTWLPAEQAVAYIDFTLDDQRTLYISRGEQVIEEAGTNVTSRHLARALNGRQVIYFTATDRGQPQVFDLVQTRATVLQANLHLPVEETTIPDYRAQYQITPHPDGKQIAFYNNNAFYLANTTNGQVCEVDLGTYSGRKQWALSAYWSPDGRYLAAFVVMGEPIVPFIHLTLVDMLTGERRLVDIDNDHLYALAWSPNSRDFLLLGQDPETDHRHKLYLVDAVTGDSRLILKDYPFINSGFKGVIWSQTGQIALTCPTIMPASPTIAEGRICIIMIGANQ